MKKPRKERGYYPSRTVVNVNDHKVLTGNWESFKVTRGKINYERDEFVPADKCDLLLVGISSHFNRRNPFCFSTALGIFTKPLLKAVRHFCGLSAGNCPLSGFTAGQTSFFNLNPDLVGIFLCQTENRSDASRNGFLFGL
jgi:hypothetical protein